MHIQQKETKIDQVFRYFVLQVANCLSVGHKPQKFAVYHIYPYRTLICPDIHFHTHSVCTPQLQQCKILSEEYVKLEIFHYTILCIL